MGIPEPDFEEMSEAIMLDKDSDIITGYEKNE